MLDENETYRTTEYLLPMASITLQNEDEDYMSDAFLLKCQDTRPGLVSSHTKKNYERQEKQKKANLENKRKPKKVLEQEKRDEGLQSAISNDNKGFALLSKMGYKPGMAIGKRGEGRTEPVGITLREGRSGLGREEHLKRKAQVASNRRDMAALKRQRTQMRLKQNFQQRMSSKAVEQKIERDLFKSQNVCEQLDCQKGIEEPVMYFFWPIRKSKKPKDDYDEDLSEETKDAYNHPSQLNNIKLEDEILEEDEEFDDTVSTEEKLVSLTEYLRKTHIYCLWCGTAFDDQEDMTVNCPGNTAIAHDE